MIKLKDKYGNLHDCDSLQMIVDFDVYGKHESNADYQAHFFIEGSNYYEDDPFIIQSGFDYYEIADVFIDLKKQLIASREGQNYFLSEKNKEVATV